ncbi:MAG: radical SAM protein [Candidatus Aenigmatarchaeota archaeon]
MSDVVLLQPRTGGLDMTNTRLPLGLLYAASFVHKEGYKVKIIDQRFSGWEGTLEKELKKGPLFVGFSCMTGPQIGHALQAAKITKKYGVTTVFGGVHPTVIPEQTLRNECVDVVARGEGEVTLLELAKTMEKNSSFDSVKGVSFKSGKKIKHNPEREFLNGEDLLTPPYELVDMKKYSSVSFRGERSYSIMGSRGCPFRCGFCYNSVSGMGSWRPFPLNKILENATALVEDYHAKTLYFEDDNICTEKKRFEELLTELAKHDVNLAFQGIRMDVLGRFTDETYRIMEAVPNLSMDMGIESVNPRILKMIDKSLTPKMINDVLKKLEKRDFVCKFNFIGGLPTESLNEIKRDVKFAMRLNKKHKKSYSLFNIYTPYPGTRLFDLAVSSGFSPPTKLEGWSEFTQMGWLKSSNSWLGRKEREYLRNISFLFMFANRNIGIKASGKMQKLAIDLYSPVAKARLKTGSHSLFIEKKIVERLIGL